MICLIPMVILFISKRDVCRRAFNPAMIEPTAPRQRDEAFGSDNGGEAAAIIYSLPGTCKLNGVEPEGWLPGYLLREVFSYSHCQTGDELRLQGDA